jgi:hypothetical protein
VIPPTWKWSLSGGRKKKVKKRGERGKNGWVENFTFITILIFGV